MQKQSFIIDGSAEKPILIDITFKKTNYPKNIVLFSHGFKGFKDWGAWHLMVEQFTKRGLSIALMNGTHNGIGSNLTEFTELDLFSRNSISAEQKDIKEALMWGPINSMNVVQYIGAQEGHLTQKKLLEYLEKKPANYEPKEF
mgnify:CR=1 FL=1